MRSTVLDSSQPEILVRGGAGGDTIFMDGPLDPWMELYPQGGNILPFTPLKSPPAHSLILKERTMYLLPENCLIYAWA